MPRPAVPLSPPLPPLHPEAVRVTLRDIAQTLGISHVAVSLALRDRPGVSDTLRAQIKATAVKLGYRPDPALAALNNYRHGRKNRPVQAALGWITMWRNPSAMHAHREFEEYWQGARQVAEKHGYHLYEFHPDSKNSLAAVQRVLIARNIEGVLLSPPETSLADNPPSLDWKHFSVVRFGHTFTNLPFHLVTSAQASNTVLAIRRMRERGYRRIGFVTTLYSNLHAQFLNGFLRANDDVPAKDRIPHCVLEESSPAADRARLASWLKKHRPDAVFSNLGSIRALLTDCGCDIPRKLGLAVTSVQDCDADSGIDQSPSEIGKTACESLISLLMNGHRDMPSHPREILVEGRWVDGSSLPLRKD